MADSPQLADLFSRSQKYRSALTEAEQMQFDVFCSLEINTVEFAFRLSEDADTDPDRATWISIAEFFLDSPGGREFVRTPRFIFRRLSKTDRKTFGHRCTTSQFVILSPTNTTGDNPRWSLT